MNRSKILGLIGNVLDLIFQVVLIVAIVYAVVQGAKRCYDYGYRVYTEPAMSAGDGREVTVTVPAGFNAKELGELFEENGLTRDWILLVLQYYGSEYREDMKAGTYTFNTSMTADEMFAMMAGEGVEVLEGSETEVGTSDSESDVEEVPLENAGTEGAEDAGAAEDTTQAGTEGAGAGVTP